MAKASGNTRIVRPTSSSITQGRKEFDAEIAKSTTDVSNSFFSNKSGGFLVTMKGHNIDEAELEAGRYLADSGIKVTLTPEGAGYEMYATFSTVKKGKTIYKYSDGKMDMSTFEQKTPSRIDTTVEQSVKQAIIHANSKHAQIALIYDKYKLYHNKDIEDGMKLYQEKFKKWETKGVKAVIVVSHSGKVYEHHFDKPKK